MHQTVLHTHIKQSKLKFYVCTRNAKNAPFCGNGGQTPSGQEITLSCTLGDSHRNERAVLCADTACHFFPRYVTWTRGDRFVLC
jgi:hypothetical protein